MIILVTGILLIVISYLFRDKLPPYFGMIFAFIIMGFQEGVNGDFMVYKRYYNTMAVVSSFEFGTAEDEPLWNYLFQVSSSHIPFWAFILLLSAFQCWVLWKVGKRYGSKEYGFLGPILFFFTFNMMLIQMKALREGLAIEMCVLAYYLITEKRGKLWTVMLALGAYFVHNSSIVVVPFLVLQLLGSVRKGMDDDIVDPNASHNKLFPIIMVVIYFVVFSMKAAGLTSWLDQLSLMLGDESRLTNYLEKDQMYIGEANISFVLILYNAIMVYLCSWFLQRTNRRYRILAVAAIIGCFGEMLLVGVGSLLRVILYYMIFNMFTYPKLVEFVAHKYGRVLAFVLIVFLVGYAMKTSVSLWMLPLGDDRFGTYRFVFM